MMMVDRRELEFSATGIVKIICFSLKAAQGFGLPGLPPSGVRFHPINGRIEVMYGSSQSVQAVSLGAEALGALLVSYCIRAHIPMPRTADKGIRVEKSSVILAFRRTFKDLTAPQTSEAVSRPTEPVAAWSWLSPEKVPTDK